MGKASRVKGQPVYCIVCGDRKAPVGRSVPLAAANSYCDSECAGYREEPRASGHWPGEECGAFRDGDPCLYCGGEVGDG
jgi:hypothetical protein